MKTITITVPDDCPAFALSRALADVAQCKGYALKSTVIGGRTHFEMAPRYVPRAVSINRSNDLSPSAA